MAAIRPTGARLVGIDFAPAALRAARATADELGLAHRVDLRVADLAKTGLDDAVADAVLCVDAFHFAGSPAAAAYECRRLLRPGGRLVITTWKPANPDAARRLPERIARMDVRRDLTGAGLVDIDVQARPDWSGTERKLWAAASNLDPGDDPAMITLRDEALEFLPVADALQRLLVTARAPG